MKTVLIACAASAFLGAAASPAARADEPPPAYDAELATALGADDYGMRAYVFVLLKTGPAEVTDEKRRKELFAGHFANMTRLAKEGALVLAGPLDDDTGKRGLFILNAPSVDAAREMVAGDPAVAAGIFTAEYSGYYGSAALMKINEIHTKIQRKKIE
ncbi:MAG: YciI family protein [Pseudomonadota bacterium]|nr:YciI family protein [Pseudomonadota bacterium]